MKTTVLKNKPISVWDHRDVELPEPTEEHKRKWAEEEARRDALSDVEREAEDKAEEDEWRSSALEGAEEVADKLRGKGYSVAISKADWMHDLDWMKELASPIFTVPPGEFVDIESIESLQARSIVLYLATGDDTLRVRIETSVSKELRDEGERWSEFLDKIDLELMGPSGRYRGVVEKVDYEMSAWVVGIYNRPGVDVPEDLPQRVLDALIFKGEWIKEWPVSLYARLAMRDRCHACNRPLKDLVSRALQLGPDCAKSMGIPHNREIADKVIAYRKQLEAA